MNLALIWNKMLSEAFTQPHVFQTNDKASREVEDREECVAHERWSLQCWQGCRHKQGHAATTIHHQPHQQEAEQEAVGSAVEPSQPVDGHTIYQRKGTVLWQLTKDLRETLELEISRLMSRADKV